MFQKGLRWLLMCAPLLKLDDFFTTTYMCHVMKPCQVSCFLGDFFIYRDLKTEILIVSGRRQVCNSFSFLKRDLNMHPMTHVRFPTHFASLEHVLVVQIWIMDYIKCVENLVINNIYNGQTNPEQFQISARHSCYSMLPVENKVQGEKRHRLLFCPQEGHVSLPEPRGLRQAPFCKRLVI